MLPESHSFEHPSVASRNHLYHGQKKLSHLLFLRNVKFDSGSTTLMELGRRYMKFPSSA
jgi:hypothetical protein